MDNGQSELGTNSSDGHTLLATSGAEPLIEALKRRSHVVIDGQ